MPFLDWDAEIRRFEGNLPHWRQEAATYFVTFRLADALPAGKLATWRAERSHWLSAHPLPWEPKLQQEYLRQFPARLERWLDEGSGTCCLRTPECRSLVEQSLRHGAGRHYVLDEFIVMPNHVHVLLTPTQTQLSRIVQVWKSFTAARINKLLGSRGALWQKEYFDHIVRSEQHLQRFRQYIQDNPNRMARAVLRTATTKSRLPST